MLVNFGRTLFNSEVISKIDLREVDFNNFTISLDFSTNIYPFNDSFNENDHVEITFNMVNGNVYLSELYNYNDASRYRFDKKSAFGLFFGKSKGTFAKLIEDCKTIVLQVWTIVNGYTIDDFDVNDWGD